MPDLTRVLRRFTIALVAIAASATTAAGAAQASTSWGELAHFGGQQGPGAGQFEPREGTAAIGVDQETNSVFVVDLPDTNGEFRIQKFEEVSGHYKVVASTIFTPTDKEGPEDPDEIEGVAVNPKAKRIYVLASEGRPANKIDAEDYSAAELFAFSTQQSGEKLVPAEGTPIAGEPNEAVLAGTASLDPLGKKAGESLLEPTGIAADPHTGGVVLLGEQETSSKQPLVALWQISETGALTGKYLDETDFFETSEGGGATSPAVSKEGNVYVTGEEYLNEIDAIPMNSLKTAFENKAATHFIEFASLEELAKFPAEPPPEVGGSLSIGEEGTIYTSGSIQEQFDKNHEYPGIIAFTAGGAEEGWTGGGSVATSGEGGPCQIGIRAPEQIAAGKEHTVFVYDSGKYSVTKKEFEPEVQEFGPSGGGCPTAIATAPQATVNGQPVGETEVIAAADEVTFSSTLTQANALSVEWTFGDGSAPVKQETSQFQITSVTHKFAKRGVLEVTEKIKTDDLATPEILEHSKVDIETPAPTVKTGEAAPIGETSVTLHGTVNPNGETVSECRFEYGLSEAVEKSEPCSPATLGSGSAAVAVTAAVSGLSAHTTYHFKLVAKGASGAESKGSSGTFTTSGSSGGGGGGGGGETPPVTVTTGTTTTGTTTTGNGGVLNNITTKAPTAPDVTLAGSAATVSTSGAFTVKLSCPAEAGSCVGTLSLKTTKAVVASVGRSAKSKAKILTLAGGSFTVTAGQLKTITLHLSASARALLARTHVVSARVTIVAHGPTGLTHTTTVNLTLRPAKRAKHH
jgi:hypothetical protein